MFEREVGSMNEKYSGTERRRFRRTQVKFTVFYRVNSPLLVRMRVGDRDVNALALDISEGGMAILTNYDIPSSSDITVRFTMLNDNAISIANRARSIVVQAEVCYNVLIKKEKAHRLGIRFVDLSEDDRNFIGNLVKAKR
jgi:c-di-GMP-binding flagellar brake protein YcgR